MHIASVDQEAGKAARAAIEAIVKVPEVGEVLRKAPVVGIQSFGAFIKLTPSKDGLLHISRMANGRVGQVEDVLSMGDMVKVQVIEIDPKSGKISLDRLEKPDAPEGSAPAPRHERGDREDRGERRDRGEKTDHRPGRSQPRSQRASHPASSPLSAAAHANNRGLGASASQTPHKPAPLGTSFARSA